MLAWFDKIRSKPPADRDDAVKSADAGYGWAAYGVKEYRSEFGRRPIGKSHTRHPAHADDDDMRPVVMPGESTTSRRARGSSLGTTRMDRNSRWIAASAAATLLLICASWLAIGALRGSPSNDAPSDPLAVAKLQSAPDAGTATPAGASWPAPQLVMPTSPPDVVKQVSVVAATPVDPLDAGMIIPPTVSVLNGAVPPATNLAMARAGIAPVATPVATPAATPDRMAVLDPSLHVTSTGLPSGRQVTPPRAPINAAIPQEPAVHEIVCIAGCPQKNRQSVVYAGESTPLVPQIEDDRLKLASAAPSSDAGNQQEPRIVCAAGCYSGPRSYRTKIRRLQTEEEQRAGERRRGIVVRRGLKRRAQ